MYHLLNQDILQARNDLCEQLLKVASSPYLGIQEFKNAFTDRVMELQKGMISSEREPGELNYLVATVNTLCSTDPSKQGEVSAINAALERYNSLRRQRENQKLATNEWHATKYLSMNFNHKTLDWSMEQLSERYRECIENYRHALSQDPDLERIFKSLVCGGDHFADFKKKAYKSEATASMASLKAMSQLEALEWTFERAIQLGGLTKENIVKAFEEFKQIAKDCFEGDRFLVTDKNLQKWASIRKQLGLRSLNNIDELNTKMSDYVNHSAEMRQLFEPLNPLNQTSVNNYPNLARWSEEPRIKPPSENDLSADQKPEQARIDRDLGLNYNYAGELSKFMLTHAADLTIEERDLLLRIAYLNASVKETERGIMKSAFDKTLDSVVGDPGLTQKLIELATNSCLIEKLGS
ncbi:MAG: hypothetical protein N2654_06700 [Deltaproteobacteria bacterium]|nr:hypothetical protein [Deltaproteobacteria bacterium]